MGDYVDCWKDKRHNCWGKHGEADDHPHNYDFIEHSLVPRISWSKCVTVIVLRVVNDKLGLLREREIAAIEENSQSTT
jgi:hypothetical protein